MADSALAPVDFPADPTGWASHAAELNSTFVAERDRLVARLTDGTARPPLETIELYSAAQLAIANAAEQAYLLAEVHPDGAVRDSFEELAREASALGTATAQDPELYAVLNAVDASALDDEAAFALEKYLKEFRLAGVDLPDEQRTEFARLEDRLTELQLEFGRRARDDVRSIRITPDRLAGLPDDFIAAHPAGEDGLVTITTDYPDIVPFRTFARDAAARLELVLANENRGWPENDAVLGEILELRARQAALLGFGSWADLDTQRKMVGSAAGIAEFLDRVEAAVAEPARADHAELLAALRTVEPDAAQLDDSNNWFAAELVRRDRYAVDSQEARPYFAADKVREGLLTVSTRLYGLEFTSSDAPSWHDDVRVYDVALDGEALGRIHLDLHPRDGKYKHAACFDVRTGITGVQLGEGALVCNFSRGLMEHDHVVTLFHEFGHLLHGLLASRHRFSNTSGIATEWDFVEAPSQMFEEWAWDPAVLQSFATDDEGAPIPVELVERMRRADGFGRAAHYARQLWLSAVSFRLHQDLPADRTALVDELRTRYDVVPQLPDVHYQCAFGHLTGYSSGYYTYLWSLVIARDLFTCFESADLFASAPATRYRERVLAPGGSKPAARLVEDFIGRPYGFEAFAAWLAGE